MRYNPQADRLELTADDLDEGVPRWPLPSRPSETLYRTPRGLVRVTIGGVGYPGAAYPGTLELFDDDDPADPGEDYPADWIAPSLERPWPLHELPAYPEPLDLEAPAYPGLFGRLLLEVTDGDKHRAANLLGDLATGALRNAVHPWESPIVVLTDSGDGTAGRVLELVRRLLGPYNVTRLNRRYPEASYRKHAASGERTRSGLILKADRLGHLARWAPDVRRLPFTAPNGFEVRPVATLFVDLGANRPGDAPPLEVRHHSLEPGAHLEQLETILDREHGKALGLLLNQGLHATAHDLGGAVIDPPAPEPEAEWIAGIAGLARAGSWVTRAALVAAYEADTGQPADRAALYRAADAVAAAGWHQRARGWRGISLPE